MCDRRLLLLAFLLICETLLVVADATPGATYVNPVIGDENLADPTVILHQGVYYLYPTCPRETGYFVYTSKDLVHWRKGPLAFSSNRPRTWAPDVFYCPEDQKFYLYYTADFKIGVALADRPEGPFKDRGLLIDHDRVIDAHMFRDDDGKLYLYYTVFGGFRMHVQPMRSPLEKSGSPVELFRPSQSWEKLAGAVNEGPWMLKHDGKYFLLYSGSGADWPDYAIGYAFSFSPLGPFIKYENNPIIHRHQGVYGPGHGAVVKDAAGKLWHVYHQKVDDGNNFQRFICIDPIGFDEHGNLMSETTRGVAQPAPATKFDLP